MTVRNRIRTIAMVLVLLAAASGCTSIPTFYEDGSWVQLRVDSNGVHRDTGCIGGDAICSGEPSWPTNTSVYSNGEWLWSEGNAYSWGCIHGFECFTEALANPIPCDGSIVDERGTFECLGG